MWGQFNVPLTRPLDNHDPLGKDYVGPMLHIVREYKPEKVYLLLTAEMMRRHNEDNRYCKSIDILSNNFIKEGKLSKKIEVIPVNLPIDDPSDYNSFPDIVKTIDEIISKEKKAKFFLNISSGTQQMGMALCVDLISNNRQVIPLQVKSPDPKFSYEQKEFNVFKAMEINLDNHPEMGAKNRCYKVDLFVLKDAKLFHKINSLTQNYRYSSALELLKYEQRFNDTKLFKLVELGEAYQNFDTIKLSQLSKELEFDLVSQDELFLILCAFNNLILKDLIREYHDFSTRITPLFFTLLCEIIGKDVINKITFEKNNVSYLNSSYLLNNIKKYNTTYNNNKSRENPFLSTQILIDLFYDIYGDDNTYEKITFIRKVEEKIRNKVAHELLILTEKKFKSMSGHTPKEVVDIFKDILKSWFNIKDTYLCFYKVLNNRILEEINKIYSIKKA